MCKNFWEQIRDRMIVDHSGDTPIIRWDVYHAPGQTLGYAEQLPDNVDQLDECLHYSHLSDPAMMLSKPPQHNWPYGVRDDVRRRGFDVDTE